MTILNKQQANKIRTYCWILFLVYLVALVYFLFFAEGFGRTFDGREYCYNLMPFKEIRRFWTYRNLLGTESVLLNILGNVIAFIPFGFILPIISRKTRKFYKILFLGFDFSLIVEIVQLIFKVGSFDIDDIILNSLGVIIGYFIFYITNLFRRKIYG